MAKRRIAVPERTPRAATETAILSAWEAPTPDARRAAHSERPLASPRTMQAHERGDRQAIAALEHDRRSRNGDQPKWPRASARSGSGWEPSRSVVVMSELLQGRGARGRFFAHSAARAWAAF